MNRLRKLKDITIKILVYIATAVTVASLACIIVYILFRGLRHINFEFLFTLPKGGGAEGGISSIIVITLMMTGLSILISTPIGICSAIY